MRIIEILDRALLECESCPLFCTPVGIYVTRFMWDTVRQDDLFWERCRYVKTESEMENACCVGYFNNLPVRIVASMPHIIVREDGNLYPITAVEHVEYQRNGVTRKA